MRWGRTAEAAGSFARVLRAEGVAAVRDRVWDRARDAAARARCVHGGREPWPAAPILNVIGVPMTTAFGGVPLQLRARLHRESMLRPVALLSREPGSRVRRGGAASTPDTETERRGSVGHDNGGGGSGAWRLELWTGGRPRRATTFPAGDWNGDPLRDDPAWLHAVRTCAGLVNARAIHVENAADLSLVSLAALASIMPDTARAGIDAPANRPRVPVLLSVHDFSLFSRDPHLPQAAVERHPPPAGDDEPHHPDRPDRARHHALGAEILRSAAFTIYPSRFMRDRVGVLLTRRNGENVAPRESHAGAFDPRLGQLHAASYADDDQLRRPAYVIAPGIELPPHATRSIRKRDRSGDPIAIALLGGGQDHKGGRRLPGLAAALVARGMRVTSYGGYGHDNLLALRRVPGVHVRGYYRAGSLPTLLARDRTSIALILSSVPESFSLVLSEAWAAGVPAIAPALGAFVERVGAAGLLLSADPSDDDEILNPVERARPISSKTLPLPLSAAGGLLLSEDPSDDEILDAVERACRRTWNAVPAPPTAAQAADRHLALYRDAGFITPAGS